jgi:NADH:ubiquinone oxidoreductase subunit 5 (subunit L)/multisubunit Na+/H+ antiporter MnhA subunit
MFMGLECDNFFVVLTLLFGIAILALVGSTAIICFTKLFGAIFLVTPRSEVAENITSETEKTMLFPMSILGIFIILLGIFPILLFNHITPNMIVQITNSTQGAKDFGIILFLMQTIATISAIFIVLLFVLTTIKKHLTKNKIQKEETWGCGYNKPNNKMQYSASSFSHPFIIMFRPLFKNIFDIEKPKGYFPKSAHYSSQTEDFEEAYLIHPVVEFDEWFLSKFETLQSGNIQSYIKYSLIFLALIIIGSLFIG